MRMAKLITWALGALVLSSGATTTAAQEYPVSPITFIYPYAAGSATDAIWRMIGSEVSKRIGQPVVHVNRPGGSAIVGRDAIRYAKPDGYTIGMVNTPAVVWLPLIDSKLMVEPGKDYTPIVAGYASPLVLVANKTLPISDLKSLIEYARARPGKLNLSTAGIGSAGHILLEMLNRSANMEITHVPYRGTGPATTAVLSGEVELSFSDGSAKPHLDARSLNGIATAASKRWQLYPDIPTFAEVGLANFEAASIVSVIGPPNMSQGVVNRLNSVFNEVLNDPEVRAKVELNGGPVLGGSPKDYEDLIRSQISQFAPVIRAANIKLE